MWNLFASVLFLSTVVFTRAYDITSDYNGHEREGNAAGYSRCYKVYDSVPSDVRNEMNLDVFYQKYTHAYKIPILASNAVSDEAMKRACYLVQFLLASHALIRETFFSWWGRIVVLGENESVLDVPEYYGKFDDNEENRKRQNGGGTLNRPVTTISESNLLCENDRHSDIDVGVHEIAHVLDELGARFALPDWNSRLFTAYNDSLNAGRWNDTYSARDDKEYFAQGVIIYLGVSKTIPEEDGPNDVYNHIGTRDQLLEYDPVLHDLIQEVLPCENDFIDRCEKSRSKEANSIKHKNCDLRKPYTETCYNRLAYCRTWAETAGRCEKYGQLYCAHACGLC